MKAKYFILLILLFFSILNAFAFIVPDLDSIGKDPIIFKFDPEFLIPGKKVKIYGESFIENPKNANKLFINGKPIRILNSKNKFIEFIVPKMALGDGIITFYTNYLGIKSNIATYNNKPEIKLPITFPPPDYSMVDKISVLPNEKIIFFGNFNIKNEIYFKLNNLDIKGNILSSHEAELTLPSKIPAGLFNVFPYYVKNFSPKVEGKKIYSPPGKKQIFYNKNFGDVKLIKVFVDKKEFNSIDKNLLVPYKVLAFFEKGTNVDITSFSEISLSNNEVIELDKDLKLFKLKGEGKVDLKAKFKWIPNNAIFEDVVNIQITLPKKPQFAEVIIDEIFPFASGLFSQTDANMDGFAKDDDEFIELKNLTNKTFDLNGCSFFIGNNDESEFIFPENSYILPDEYLVIFGGDLEMGSWNFSNSGSTVEFICNEKTVDYIAYPSGKNGDPSWQRKPNLSGFEKHPGKIFSPGVAPNNPVSSSGNLSVGQDGNSTTSSGSLEPDENKIISLSVNPNPINITEYKPFNFSTYIEYENGIQEDITEKAIYKIKDLNFVKLEKQGTLSPLANGFSNIEVTFSNQISEVPINVSIPTPAMIMDLIINEIYASPDFDTNNDGILKTDEDEFLEIVNISGSTLDLGGLIIADKTSNRHVIPFGTYLENLEPLIVFGGGLNTNFSQNIKSQIASSQNLGLNNFGEEKVIVKNVDGSLIIDEVTFDNKSVKGISLNRTEDLKFVDFKFHNELSTLKISPGVNIFGFPFSSSSGGTSSSSSGGTPSSSSSGGGISSSSSGGTPSSSSGGTPSSSSSGGGTSSSSSGGTSSSSSSGGGTFSSSSGGTPSSSSSGGGISSSGGHESSSSSSGSCNQN